MCLCFFLQLGLVIDAGGDDFVNAGVDCNDADYDYDYDADYYYDDDVVVVVEVHLAVADDNGDDAGNVGAAPWLRECVTVEVPLS